MRKFLCVALLCLLGTAWPIDRIEDLRYTLGPEVKNESTLQASFGWRTHFASDNAFSMQAQAKLSERFEVGGKLISEEDVKGLDLGGKILFKKKYLELDGFIELDDVGDFAGALTYGARHSIAKNFFIDMEVKAAAGNAVVDPDGYFKLYGAVLPTFKFEWPVMALFEINMSGSPGAFTDDFKVDLIPKIKAKFGRFAIHAEYNIGILLESNNRENYLGVYGLYCF